MLVGIHKQFPTDNFRYRGNDQYLALERVRRRGNDLLENRAEAEGWWDVGPDIGGQFFDDGVHPCYRTCDNQGGDDNGLSSGQSRYASFIRRRVQQFYDQL